MFSDKLKSYSSGLLRIVLVLAAGWALAAMWLALPNATRAVAAPPPAARGALSLSLPVGAPRAPTAVEDAFVGIKDEDFPSSAPHGQPITVTIIYTTVFPTQARIDLETDCVQTETWDVPSNLTKQSVSYLWDTKGCPGGDIRITAILASSAGAAIDTDILKLWPPVPTITLPLEGQQLPTPHPYVAWSKSTGAMTHTLQIASDAMFTSPVVSATLFITSYIVPEELPPGDYYIRVAAKNQYGFQWSETRHFKIGGIHLIVFAPWDNNLSPLGPELIDNLRQGTLANPLVQVTLLLDSLGGGNTWVYTIENGLVFTGTNAIPWLPGEHELDSANEGSLKDFLLWARAKYPAQRTMLALLGHGAGPIPDIIFSEPANLYRKLTFFQADRGWFPPTPINRDNTSMDAASGTSLNTVALNRALAPVTYSYGPFDLLFFDQCFQANLEVLYQVRGAARYFIASTNYAWAALPYDRYLQRLTLTESLSSTAQTIVREYEAALNENHPNAIVWLPAETITNTAQAVSALGDALIQVLDEHRDWVLTATLQSKYVDTTLCVGDLELCPPDQLVDLRLFVLNLRDVFSGTEHTEVITAANAVLAELNGVHAEWITGPPWIKLEHLWDLSQASLTILAPLTPTLSSEWVWMASIYTNQSMLSAERTDAYGITSTVTISSPLAFAVLGWPRFIDAWYENPLKPRVGNMCFEMPPSLVISGPITTSAVTLTAASTVASVELGWKIDPEMGAKGISIYVHQPGFVIWGLLANVPVSSTTYLHYGMLRSGEYEYFVAARTAGGEIITRSNVVTVELGIAAVTPSYALNDGSGQFTLHTYQTLPQSPLTVTLEMTQVVQAERIDDYTLRMSVPAGQKLGWYEVFLHTLFGSVYLPHAVKIVPPPVFLPLVMH